MKVFLLKLMIKTKWFSCGCYYPPSQSDQYFFEILEKCYINIQNMIHLFVADFTAEESEPCLAHFLYECNAKNIVN